MKTKRKITSLEVIANTLPVNKPFTKLDYCELLDVQSRTAATRLYSLANVLGFLDISNGEGQRKVYNMSHSQKRQILKYHRNNKKMMGKRPKGSRSTMTFEERKAIANRESAEEILRKAGIFLSVRG